jgi:hypothetical protein
VTPQQPEADPVPRVGDRIADPSSTPIGRVDAVFADYVLVRTRGLPPVDLYVPRPELSPRDDGGFRVEADPRQAYERWHRPLRKSPHP